MNAQDLKNSILQLAVQGKLVEQRPEEGTAQELLKQIKAEKEKLIKEKKIKKEKPLPEITDDEIPFEIPSSWKWVRHNDLFEIVGGSQPPKSYFESFPKENYVRLYQIRDYGEKPIPVYVPNDRVTKFTQKGDILLARYGASVGKVFWAEDGAYNVAMARVVKLFENDSICNEYLFYYYLAPIYQSLVRKNSRSAQAGFNKDDLVSLLFPLPPLAEQKRIVAKIEEILPYIDQYDKAYTKLENFNKKFPEDMKKSILQLAMQGKLVEQRPEEGNADELYELIISEKAQLIKEGKIKKEKPLPEITEDEIPFEIPSSWKWVRIGCIFTLQAGKNISATQIFENKDENHPFLCYGGNGVRGYVEQPNRSGHYAIIGRQGALCGCINFADGDFYATEHAVVVDQYNLTDTKWCGLFLKALNLNQYATATAQPGLAVANINQVLIPLPPLAEQKRIVAKIDELLPYCDQLVK